MFAVTPNGFCEINGTAVNVKYFKKIIKNKIRISKLLIFVNGFI